MDYRNYGGTYYVRLDRGDEVVDSILSVCKRERVRSAVFTGIGAAAHAEIQTFIPETGLFETREIAGMLEIVSLTGNIITGDNGAYYPHTHGVFSYKDGERHCIAAGHVKSATVSYTAEIELRPVSGGEIKRKYDPQTGTGFWDFQ